MYIVKVEPLGGHAVHGYQVSVLGAYHIKDKLKECGYTFNAMSKAWCKPLQADHTLNDLKARGGLAGAPSAPRRRRMAAVPSGARARKFFILLSAGALGLGDAARCRSRLDRGA